MLSLSDVFCVGISSCESFSVTSLEPFNFNPLTPRADNSVFKLLLLTILYIMVCLKMVSDILLPAIVVNLLTRFKIVLFVLQY